MLTSSFQQADMIFRKRGGIIRTRDALAAGIHPRTLYAMRDSGAIHEIGRGLFRLTGLPPLGNPDLVTVALKAPGGVICLISALSFHEITTQVPHEVDVAFPKGTEAPRLSYPPVRPTWMSDASVHSGIETHKLDGIPVLIYSPEKTLADCFKFRVRVGKEVCLEALNLYCRRKNVRIDALLEFARICRVEKVMKPYLEAML